MFLILSLILSGFLLIWFWALQWLGTLWFITIKLQVFGPSSASQQQRPLRSDCRVNARRLWALRGKWKRKGDGNEGANCFQWILKSNSIPQCMGLVVRKWNIDDRSENKGKWPRCMIDLKATDLCRTCLYRQHISPVFLWIRIYLPQVSYCWDVQILAYINLQSLLFITAMLIDSLHDRSKFLITSL